VSPVTSHGAVPLVPDGAGGGEGWVFYPPGICRSSYRVHDVKNREATPNFRVKVAYGVTADLVRRRRVPECQDGVYTSIPEILRDTSSLRFGHQYTHQIWHANDHCRPQPTHTSHFTVRCDPVIRRTQSNKTPSL
jgi:hypothetical protein